MHSQSEAPITWSSADPNQGHKLELEETWSVRLRAEVGSPICEKSQMEKDGEHITVALMPHQQEHRHVGVDSPPE